MENVSESDHIHANGQEKNSEPAAGGENGVLSNEEGLEEEVEEVSSSKKISKKG